MNDIQHNIYTFALHRNPISEVKRGGVISIFDRSFELSHVLSLLLDILVINKVFESKSDFLFFVPILRVSCILTYLNTLSDLALQKQQKNIHLISLHIQTHHKYDVKLFKFSDI